VHGLSDAFLADKPRFAERAADLLAFLGDSPLVAHNAGFDFGFLNAELAICGMGAVDRGRMIDTVALARVRHPGAKLSLDALCTRYGIDRSHRTRHGALLDAELLAQVYVELTGGRQIGLELAANSTGTLVASVVTTKRERAFRAPRPHAASEEELAAHATFLESIKSPVWNS
jgi:DNA polymerase III subunit epsilon